MGKKRSILSVRRVGDAYDIAMCESFFATLDASCWDAAGSHRRLKPEWRSSATSRGGTIPPAAISGIRYLSPIAYEMQMLKQTQTT